MKMIERQPRKQQNKENIAIIDYGAGNLSSVKNALDNLGIKSIITDNPDKILAADKIIFPGVGNFGFMMNQLRKKNLDLAIRKAVSDGKKFLGICLGMQALFEESEESHGVKGLGIFKGKVMKFNAGKVPQIGWNKIISSRVISSKANEKSIKSNKKNIFKDEYMYFVNSYYVVPEDKAIIAAKTDYFGEFASAVQYKNIAAVQFHPEKSGKQGIELLRRWLKLKEKYDD